MALDVYNLEFRNRCFDMTIGGYRFERVDNYATRLLGLQHRVTCHSEFSVEACTGANQVTARVTPPEPEPRAILPWSNAEASGLDDISLLLSIFTGRQVFVPRDTEETEGPRVLLADPRETLWDGVIRLSIPYEASAPLDDEPSSIRDDGLQIHLNRVYQMMGTDAWRDRYRGGYYLFLFRSALQERTIESAFSQCWTVWEHLFSVLSDPWMTSTSIRNANSSDKIAFLLVNYAVRERLQEKEKSRIKALSEIRNRLIHFGELPRRSSVHDDAMLFISMTQWIVARTLGLQPSEVFDTLNRFEQFMSSTAGSAQQR